MPPLQNAGDIVSSITIFVTRRFAVDGTATYLVRGEHADGKRTFYYANGRVYAGHAEL